MYNINFMIINQIVEFDGFIIFNFPLTLIYSNSA